ncbi:MAG: hypothetical protein KDC97_13705 [Confluentibacter sp.]|nr:hypothetical protein [Confluentibacter sp.]
MDALFNYIKAKVVDHITPIIEKNTKNNKIQATILIKKIESLENLNQLAAFIDKKLVKHHRYLKKAGINYKEFRLFKKPMYARTYEIMNEHNISIDEIFTVINLKAKEKSSYIKKHYPAVSEKLTKENIAPFNVKKIKRHKNKSTESANKEVRLIYTPMGNKMR